MPSDSPKHAFAPVLVALGLAIRDLRRRQGISQEELAHRSEIERSYLSSIERGRQNVGVMALAQIAAALDLAVHELFAAADL